MGKRLAETLTTPLRKNRYSRLAIGEEWYSLVARMWGLTTHQLRCAIRDELPRQRRASAAMGNLQSVGWVSSSSARFPS
jgi:hypothetical protein